MAISESLTWWKVKFYGIIHGITSWEEGMDSTEFVDIRHESAM